MVGTVVQQSYTVVSAVELHSGQYSRPTQWSVQQSYTAVSAVEMHSGQCSRATQWSVQ